MAAGHNIEAGHEIRININNFADGNLRAQYVLRRAAIRRLFEIRAGSVTVMQ